MLNSPANDVRSPSHNTSHEKSLGIRKLLFAQMFKGLRLGMHPTYAWALSLNDGRFVPTKVAKGGSLDKKETRTSALVRLRKPKLYRFAASDEFRGVSRPPGSLGSICRADHTSSPPDTPATWRGWWMPPARSGAELSEQGRQVESDSKFTCSLQGPFQDSDITGGTSSKSDGHWTLTPYKDRLPRVQTTTKAATMGSGNTKALNSPQNTPFE